MPLAIAKLKSVSAYSASRYLLESKASNESHDDFEKRIWREKAHVVKTGPQAGKVYIPPMAFKQAMESAAKYASIAIPGKGKATYTKHFLSGVIVAEPLILPVSKDDLDYYAGPMSSTAASDSSDCEAISSMVPNASSSR